MNMLGKVRNYFARRIPKGNPITGGWNYIGIRKSGEDSAYLDVRDFLVNNSWGAEIAREFTRPITASSIAPEGTRFESGESCINGLTGEQFLEVACYDYLATGELAVAFMGNDYQMLTASDIARMEGASLLTAHGEHLTDFLWRKRLVHPAQDRGTPYIPADVLETASRLEQFDKSEFKANLLAAKSVLKYRKSRAQSGFSSNESSGAKERFDDGTLFELEDGAELEFIDTGRPNSDSLGYRKGQIEKMASGAGCDVYGLTKNYEGASYSSARQSILNLEESIAEVARVIYGVAKAIVLRTEGKRIAFSRSVNAYLDPSKEVSATLELVREGIITKDQAARLLGFN